MAIILVVIDGYFIDGYWWLLMTYINGCWWIFYCGYWWLLMIIILMVIGEYSIVDFGGY